MPPFHAANRLWLVLLWLLVLIFPRVRSQHHHPDGPSFRFDYFSNNIPHLNETMRKLGFAGKADLVFLEIGSFEGRSTRWFLEHVVTHKNARLVCIDTWLGSEEMRDGLHKDHLYQRFIHNVFPYLEKVELIRGDSNKMIYSSLVRDKRYDVIYIDADHYAKAALAQAIVTWPLLKPGGLMVWDDYEWAMSRCGPQHDDLFCPKQGVDAFLKMFGDELTVVFKGYQVGVQKK
eukprot:gene33262-40240_t